MNFMCFPFATIQGVRVLRSPRRVGGGFRCFDNDFQIFSKGEQMNSPRLILQCLCFGGL